MFKNLLLWLANKIIDKYGIHILSHNSIIQLDNFRYDNFKIKTSEIGQNNFKNYISLYCEGQ